MVDLMGSKRPFSLFGRRSSRNGSGSVSSTDSSLITPLSPPKKSETVTVLYKNLIKSTDYQVNSLNVDKLHVLKIMNRESDSPVQKKERLFSKYSPLPSIKPEKPAEKPKPLVREKTYRVLDPVYVKGPQDERRFRCPSKASKQELPLIEDNSPRIQKGGKVSARSKSRNTPNVAELKLSPPKNKTKALLGDQQISDMRKIKESYERRFCPNKIEDKGPGNNVFWLPM